MKNLAIISMVAILMAMTVTGCGEKTVVARESLGTIVDANVVPTSFNESVKMQIKTEKLVFIIYTITEVPIGAEATKITYSNGMSYVTWEGSAYNWRL